MHVQSIYSICEDEFPVRTKIAWEIVRSVIDSEGFIPSEDNRGQIRAILNEVVTNGSADIDGIYEDARRTMSGSWANLNGPRTHAVESALADAEIDLLGRKARRPPLEDELSSPRYSPAREHWRKALTDAKEQPPNFPNAVKEAASAVESLAQIVLDKPGVTLGDAVKELRSQKRIPIGADSVLNGIWAFANSAPGARHGSALPAHVDESHWEFVRTSAEAAIRLLLDLDAT